MRLRTPVFALLLIILLSACSSRYSGEEQPGLVGAGDWTHADLRALDPVDSEVEMDLLAAYVHESAKWLHFRLDFLQMGELPDFDIQILIDTRPFEDTCVNADSFPIGNCDLAITIPADGDIQIRRTYHSSRDRIEDRRSNILVSRDPQLDFITISLPASLIFDAYAKDFVFLLGKPPAFTFKVLISKPGSEKVADSSPIIRSDSTPPQPASVLFAFKNAFPAYTPALALRRWDGAHTGPWGGRHGLYNLLRTAKNHQIPIFLLDISSPASLSALDYGDFLPLLQDMVNEQLLFSPMVIPAGDSLPFTPPVFVFERFNELWMSATENFDFPSSRMLYSPFGYNPVQGWVESGSGLLPDLLFIPRIADPGSTTDPTLGKLTSPYSWQGAAVIPVPATDPTLYQSSELEEASIDGPTLSMRKALIETALFASQPAASQTHILVLGGDLPASTWGIPQASRAAFNYIATHPWIRPLDAYELTALGSTASPLPVDMQTDWNDPLFQDIADDLFNAPQNMLSSSGWQYLNTLYAPVTPQPPELAQLRTHYLGQTGVLIAASRWADQPADTATCSLDINYDGKPECILASRSIYTIYDQKTSALTYAFARSDDGDLHQIIAPSSLLISGLGDPSSWDPGNGLSADPQVIIGAFVSSDPPDHLYLDGNNLVFQWGENHIQKKIYSLKSDRISVHFEAHGAEPFDTRIPIVVDPWFRFTAGYADRYPFSIEGSTLSINVVGGPSISITGPGALTVNHFADSRESMAVPENPNRDYSAGHYLPFPLIEVELSFPAESEPGVDIIINQ
jgi:hypothetical protein